MSENASEPDKMQVKTNSADKQSKNGDEQLETMTVDKIDPAILVVRDSAVIYRYSKTQLIELRDAPISRNKPTFFDVNEISPSILDPEKWNLERKKSDTPTENGSKPGDAGDHRRRPNDPRERIRKENDGIVLSPQRRSFNSGCFVPVRETSRSNRSHSPLGAKNDSSLMKAMGRDVGQSGTRRIGSGRILRDWDISDRPSDGDDYGFSRGGGPSKGDDKYDRRDDKYDRRGGGADDKYDRRSFGREFDGGKEKEGGKKNGRYSERRKYSEMKSEDEPEWFSVGPISQNDTIELRGFDESEKLIQKKKLSPSRVKRAKEWSKKKNESQSSIAEEKEKEEKDDQPKETSTQNSGQGETKAKEKPSNAGESAEAKGQEHAFNFDDILKCDTIPGLLTNGIAGDGDASKSRFSRWFKKESPERGGPADGSRRSSTQEENHVIKDLLRDFTEPSVSIPGDYDSYFAPISPAASTGGQAKPPGRPINLVEMLQRGRQQAGGGGDGMLQMKQPPVAGKILSLDELEAKIRQNTDAGMHPKPPQQKPDEEMTAAFKRLLAQAGSHPIPQNGPMPKAQPMSLLEMLNHSQQQEEAARLMNQNLMGGGQTQNMSGLAQHAHGMSAMNDLTLKLQQAAQAQQQQKQMEMLNKLINAGVHHPQQLRASPLHDMGVQQSRDLLNRPEAQAILQGLKRGEITTQHLYQQLANPALQPRHRDMLATILKLQGANGNSAAGYGPSPRALSPVPPPQHFYHQPTAQQQQLRVSPLPPNAMHQRIPSPRELQVHTQNILQRALIKKKLEEQTENYRKKQEMQQRGTSPGSAAAATKSVSSPTPLAFTPTSVLRKMTADKDDGKENREGLPKPQGRAVTGVKPQQPAAQQQPQQAAAQPQWMQQFGLKQPAGRPIVKANNFPAAQSQTAEQFFREQQQQQRLFGVQQQAQQQQQRKPPAQYAMGQGNPYQGNPYSGQQFSQQLTQQQMRAQHQARPHNQQQQQQQQSGQQQQGGFQQNQQQQQQGGSSWQQFLHSAQGNGGGRVRAGSRPADDGLSPTTTDQLARWFSPDLLERARGGELPSTAGLPQRVLSLEEIEQRQTAPPVHN